ncbi:hypothetical protein [Saccharolobus islandicus]|uniref:Uncharacterized protein n=5 Tax=Saccharolobus islandicus TaxID=43080 RepID=F0NCH2_SACI5|nr:hypothetical protein [Sulfolobus islandicus]ACP38918.1 conserved hypothetical protein [Sulfolobus islandicus M.14.25]ACP56121.1 conserved hypothetical protein [Sulfolobus islandicus M.16.27]ACR42786.1 conserved hypothetical protein [Sulfolobus islandicus M.16.4]ADX83471.1 conserved hypothetical protein [Sulfolobus islandicus HVE10/4]ADX86119.1 conserved hypothetical protein [Sulfolobus islandicus REY15A]
MKTALLALVIAGAFVAGLTTAGVAGYGPLAYISYHIMVSQQQGQAQVIPAYINLGNLSAGEKGNTTATAVINISSNGTYTIDLLHADKLQKVFSNFTVELKINNHTIILTPENDSDHISLASGSYKVSILIVFQVSQDPRGDLNVSNEPLLIIHPQGDDNS